MQSYNIYIHCNYTNIKPFINFNHVYLAKLRNIKQVYCKTNLVKKPESVCIWSDLIIKSLSHNHKFKSKLQGFKSIALQWWFKSYIQGDGMHFSLSKAAFSNVSL